MVQLKLESIINENLFSRNYLEEKLVETTVWETDEELEEAFERAKQIYENNKDILPTLTNNEAQLEDIFIKPIFEEVLGHHFAVQETTKHTAKQPDYGFFENEEVSQSRAVYQTYKREYNADWLRFSNIVRRLLGYMLDSLGSRDYQSLDMIAMKPKVSPTLPLVCLKVLWHNCGGLVMERCSYTMKHLSSGRR